MIRKFITVTITLCMLFTFAGCNNTTAPATEETADTATVRYLNFKPEVASVYADIAAAYKEETGRTVLVETAANNTYEQTLTAKMATSDSPTIFQINGPRGYANWASYCADLSQSPLYQHLTDKSLAITKNGAVYGIPYVVEGYGIIYNNAIMEKYFALKNRATSLQSMEDVQDFEALKALAEDLQAHKEELGIRGAFAATSLKPGEDWRWQTHLANIPLYYEFMKNNVDMTGTETHEITFEFAENFRNIFDLYIHNSTVDPKTLGTKIVDESMTEFALGQCAMVQNGTWAWNQIRSVAGNTVSEDEVKYLPIYTGTDKDKDQGICIGTESFLCINAKASETEQQAAQEFLYWLFSSDTGKKFVTEELGFIAPFDTFTADERPDDPLAKELFRYMDQKNTVNIPWQFTLFPGQTFKDDFGAALLQYAQGTKTWDDVKNTVIKRWKEESALL